MKKKRRTNPRPITTFRIFPQQRPEYIRVRIWSTAERMYRAAEYEDGERTRHYWAMVTGVRRLKVNSDGSTKELPIVAEMYFSADSLGPLTISHEAVHAAMRFCERIGVKVKPNRGTREISEDDPEDVFAYAVGHITNEIVRRALVAKVSPGNVWVPKKDRAAAHAH